MRVAEPNFGQNGRFPKRLRSLIVRLESFRPRGEDVPPIGRNWLRPKAMSGMKPLGQGRKRASTEPGWRSAEGLWLHYPALKLQPLRVSLSVVECR